MKRYLWPVFILIIAAGVQGNLPPWLSLLGGKPNLFLVVLIAYALAEDPAFGAGLGFVAGLIEGSLVGLSMGSFIVTRTVTGFFAGLTTTRLFGDNPLVPIFSATWLTFICEGVFLLLNPRVVDFIIGLKIILGECVLNALLCFLLYILMGYFQTRKKIKLANSRI